MNHFFSRGLLVLSVFAISVNMTGCAFYMVGENPSSTPPRLVKEESTGKLVWDHPEAFGKVSPELMARGERECAKIQGQGAELRPLGYHPKAIDLQGHPFKDGAYLCAPR